MSNLERWYLEQIGDCKHKVVKLVDSMSFDRNIDLIISLLQEIQHYQRLIEEEEQKDTLLEHYEAFVKPKAPKCDLVFSVIESDEMREHLKEKDRHRRRRLR